MAYSYLTFDDASYSFAIEMEYVRTLIPYDPSTDFHELTALNPFFDADKPGYKIKLEFSDKFSIFATSNLRGLVSCSEVQSIPVFNPGGAFRFSNAFIHLDEVCYILDIDVLFSQSSRAYSSLREKPLSVSRTTEAIYPKWNVKKSLWLFDILFYAHHHHLSGDFHFVFNTSSSASDFMESKARISLIGGRPVYAIFNGSEGLSALYELAKAKVSDVRYFPDAPIELFNIDVKPAALLSKLFNPHSL